MNTHVVMKALPGPNGTLQPGTEVDASEWRNAPLLVSQRYLKPLDGVEAQNESTASESIQEPTDFDRRVINIVLNDLKNNGEIAQFLKRQIPAAAKSRGREKTARK